MFALSKGLLVVLLKLLQEVNIFFWWESRNAELANDTLIHSYCLKQRLVNQHLSIPEFPQILDLICPEVYSLILNRHDQKKKKKLLQHIKNLCIIHND